MWKFINPTFNSMKKIVLLMMPVFLCCFTLTAQNKLQKSGYDHNVYATHYKLKHKDARSIPDSVNICRIEINKLQKKGEDRSLSFPGASRHYAKFNFDNLYSYSDSFILKPDTSKKYYLLIIP